MTTELRQKWSRVNRDQPCPVCRKRDWCMISTDGTAALCARVQSDKPAGNNGAGWIHKLDGSPLPIPQITITHKDNYPLAPIHRRDLVYNALLWELTLSDIHQEHLQKRGLTDLQIEVLGYKTLPQEGRATVIRQLINGGMLMAGVPGFYFDNGDVKLSSVPGILIPVRDVQGRIKGLQVRADKTDNGKYRWVSSAGKPHGCSSGSPIHVSHPEYANSEIWITEGPIKADITAVKLHRCVLAVAGVANWRGIIPVMLELKPSRIVVAFDMDKRTNETVQRNCADLTQALLRFTNDVFETQWDSQYKGIDDLLTSLAYSTSLTNSTNLTHFDKFRQVFDIFDKGVSA